MLLQKILPLGIFLAALLPALPSSAQSHDHEDDCCLALPESKLAASFRQMLQDNGTRQSDLKSVSRALRPSSPSQSVIDNTGEVYVMRVALCLTYEVAYGFNSGDFETVNAWWNEAERVLNSIYRDDVGVEMRVVRDPNLICLAEDAELPLRNNEGSIIITNAVPLINKLIGEDAYDLGLLVANPKGSLQGQAYQGGGAFPTMKAAGWATTSHITISHEIGHLLGAGHSHQIENGDCTEPGTGQSVMSYGYPRDFMGMAALKAIRSVMKNLNVYLSEERSDLHADYSRNAETTNMPWVYAEEGGQPEIDRERLRKEYVVTQGSNFQFYLPLKNHVSEPVASCVHGFDITSMQGSNALIPAYKSQVTDCVMFQPYYLNPASLASDATYPQYELYSDDSRPGLYTFLGAVHQRSLYDSEKLKLRIVTGLPFQVSISSPTNFIKFYWGNQLKLTWTPQTELYGTDSKVRILLSKDFGQTFPYVLADDVPNTGEWTGAFPYVEIGKTAYRGYPSSIKGGCIKVEVKNEAVYGISPSVPYTVQGSEVVYSGGFELSESTAKVLFQNAPEPFVNVASEEEIGEIPTLKAYRKTAPSTLYSSTAKEEREGNIVRRSWTANVNGTPYTYTQIFILPDVLTDEKRATLKAKDLTATAKDLYEHKGQMAYPKVSTEVWKAFVRAYEDVFTEDGALKEESLTLAKVDALESALEDLNNLGDDEIVMPLREGKYLLRSYQAMPATTPYYYYKRDAEGNESFTSSVEEATPLCLTFGTNCVYLEDEAGRTPYLEGFTNPGPDIKLERGYTWGSYTLVNLFPAAAQLSRTGNTFSAVYDYASNPVAYRCNNSNGVIVSTDFQFVPLDEEKVSFTISNAGYATFFTDKAFQMPDGVRGGIVTDTKNEKAMVDYRYPSGEVVPAQTALLLNGSADTYEAVVATSSESAPTENLLHGTLTDALTDVEGATAYYKLAYRSSTDRTLGFFWAAENGAAFTNKAGKAFLALTSSASIPRGFILEDSELTVVTDVKTEIEKDDTVYGLDGRRFNGSHLPKGIYVKNGKKIIVNSSQRPAEGWDGAHEHSSFWESH